jgi:hypothetical protein
MQGPSATTSTPASLRIGAIVVLSAPITDRAVTAARLLGDLTGETRGQPRVCGFGQAALMSPLTKMEHTMKYLPALAAAVVMSITPAAAQYKNNNANGAFLQMLAETGCESKYSDDKKADLYATKYKGKQMTVTGEVTNSSDGKLFIKVLRSTFTNDITVTLADRKSAYDVEKGQRITVQFNVSFHGGCFLSYSGENGGFCKGETAHSACAVCGQAAQISEAAAADLQFRFRRASAPAAW